LLWEERIGKQELFSLALPLQAECRQLLRLFFCQPVFFFPERRGKANDRDGGLDFARAFNPSVLVRRDAHRATGERPKGIYCAAPVGAECGAGQVLELLGQLFGKMVRPAVQHR